MEADRATRAAEPGQPFNPALSRVLDSARRFVVAHERAATLQALAPPPPLSFAEGVERDRLAFQIERAARELRDALQAVEPGATQSGQATANSFNPSGS